MNSPDSEIPKQQFEGQSPHDSERHRILDAAVKAIAVHRHGDPGVHDILREAGVSGRTLYAHFPSKDGLYVGLVRREFDAEIASMAGRLAQADEPLAQIEIWLDAYLDWHFHPEYSSHSVLTLGPVTRAAGYMEAVKDYRHQIAQVLAESIARATDLGQATSRQPVLDAVSIRAIIDSVCDELETSAPTIDRSAVKAHVKRFAWAAIGLADET